jgi:antitoxin (DNA-binding transcriptional repressor) of toxin-antitoxin stability system
MGVMKQIRRLAVREVRGRLAEVLGAAAAGRVTVVTRAGRAVAAVVSGQCKRRDRIAAWETTLAKKRIPFKQAMEEVFEEDKEILRRLANL